MTKQEDIRKGFKDIWCEDCEYHEAWDICSPCTVKISKLFQYLHSQGCVLKVDKPSGIQLPVLDEAFKEIVEDMKVCGYEATEPLIEEKK